MKNILSLTIVLSASAVAQVVPVPEGERTPIPYSSPAEALTQLRLNPDVQVGEREGWTLAYDRRLHTVWAFAPPMHPSYPSVVRRSHIQREGKVFVDMAVLCLAGKDACADLAREASKFDGGHDNQI